MVFSLFAGVGARTAKAAAPGDVDGDGSVTMVDALLAARAAVGSITLTDAQRLAADVNGDLRVDMIDVLLIARMAVTPVQTVAVTVGSSTMSLLVGANGTIVGTTMPSDATITYASSDVAKATVSTTGLVTGVAVGTANITVTAAKTGYTSGTATVAVTVTALPPATIATPAIAGVTAPVTGATPTATIAATSEYTATVSWSGSPATFAAATIYTATIILTPTAGYTLTGVTANFFTVAGATATNAADSGVVSAVFPATAPVQLTIADPTLTLSKRYDGTTTAAVTAGALAGVVGGDVVTVSAAATYDTAAVGTGKTITVVYTLGGADAATYVTPVNYTVATGVIRAVPPARTPITAIDAITGTPQVGVVLTAGALTPAGATASYQWQIAATSDGVYADISGETSNTYTPVTGDTGKFIKVVATGTGNYSDTVQSAATTVVTDALAQVAQPTWSGDAINWVDVANETSYDVQLYKGGVTSGTAVNVAAGTTTYDFASAIIAAASGTYTVTVTAKGNGLPYTDGAPSTPSAGNVRATISDLALDALVTAPVTGATPSTAAIDATQYTGTIAWFAADGVTSVTGNFAASTVYVGKVTLTAKAGYTLTGVALNSFTYTGATSVANAANAGVVTITFPATVIIDVTSAAFTLIAANNTVTITLTGGTFAAGPFTATDFTFTGTDATALGATGTTFTRTNDAVVTITGLTGLTGTNNTVLVKAATQATQASSVAAAASTEASPFTYTTSGDHKVTITGYTGTPPAEITIPSALGGNPVTIIGFQAFLSKTTLTKVTIPDSVTIIGDQAFDGCTGLTSVAIPNSVTSIGNYAFAFCSGLISVTIPNSVTSIGAAAFANCTGLTTITIPNNVTSIGDTAFSGCTKLADVTIGTGVITIGVSAFYNCSSLTSVIIPNSVTTIEYQAFYGCTLLTSVTIGGAVTTIGVNLMDNSNNEYFKTAYYLPSGGAGTYAGTWNGPWIRLTLKTSSTVKGVQVTSLGTPNATLGSAVAGAVTITAAQAANTSNAGSFITLFDKTDTGAVKVVKYAFGGSTDGFATDVAYANETITNADFFIVEVTAGATVLYYKVVVTVTLFVGDSYGGGIVAYILQSGDTGYDANFQHGLIAAAADQNAGAAIVWWNGSYTTTGATGTALGTGMANTNAIITSPGNTGSYAAKICRDYGDGVYTDWYLPSKDELAKLYAMKVLGFGGFASAYYWSSTEYDAYAITSWCRDFNNGNQYYALKDYTYYVRAVRAF